MRDECYSKGYCKVEIQTGVKPGAGQVELSWNGTGGIVSEWGRRDCPGMGQEGLSWNGTKRNCPGMGQDAQKEGQWCWEEQDSLANL